MSLTTVFNPGTRLRYEGETWEVQSVSAGSLTLVGPRMRRQVVNTAALITDPAYEPILDADAQAAVNRLGMDLFAAAPVRPTGTGEIAEKSRHMLEVITGHPMGALEGPEVRPVVPANPLYDPTLDKKVRYQNKARELGVSVSTIERWVASFKEHGPEGLVSGNKLRARPLLQRLDQRWVDTARAVIARQSATDESAKDSASTKDRKSLLLEIERAVSALAAVPMTRPISIPGKTQAYEALNVLTKGTSTFGSTKARDSIANRPQAAYGSLRASRPGELVLLDSTRLDVFAMQRVSMRWVRCELTVAMDLLTRRIVGLKLTPVSTRSIDVADVLYEVCSPAPPQRPCLADHLHRPTGAPFQIPAYRIQAGREHEATVRPTYSGLPDNVVVDADECVDIEVRRTMQPTASHDLNTDGLSVEAFVVDHGKIFIGTHVRSVCTALGISLFPCRAYAPTDKAEVERFFRTLRRFLQELDGYKGSDVYHRGRNAEGHAFWFIDELEAMIREWIITDYHQTPSEGLIFREEPGLELSPDQALQIGLARTGSLRVPLTPDVLLGFLQPKKRTIQHYGFDVNNLRYNSPVLDPWRDAAGPFDGEYVLRVDPRDVRYVWWQDPQDQSWHRLTWTGAQDYPFPFSEEVLALGRAYAADENYHLDGDTRAGVALVLNRWKTGDYATSSERLAALHLSRNLANELDFLGRIADQQLAETRRKQLDAPPAEPVLGDDDTDDLTDDDPDPYADRTRTVF